MGCARLGVLPEPEVIGAFLQALVSDSGRNLQALANSAWALAVLEVCWMALVRQAYCELASSC